MPKVARIGDSISHGGVIITGSPDHWELNSPTARLTDLAVCSIHGIVSIVSSSEKTHINTLGVARIGDSLSCGAVITSGSPYWTDEG